MQLAIPSRQDVEEYQNLRSCVNELVGRINGRFGTVESVPIHYMHTSVALGELTSMYALADACLVTSTRDGMNLVSFTSNLSDLDGFWWIWVVGSLGGEYCGWRIFHIQSREWRVARETKGEREEEEDEERENEGEEEKKS